MYVKQKLWFFLYIFLLYFNFYFNCPFLSFPFQKQNLVTNSKHIWWLLTQNYQNVYQKVTDIVGNIGLVSLIAWQNITWLNFHKIQNFICIQTCDKPNFKKPERKSTFMSTQKGGGKGVLDIWQAFADSIILNNRSIVHFLRPTIT